MNRIYFVRHSKPDFRIKDDATRPLSEEGIKLCEKVNEYFRDKHIDVFYSSPYRRCVETIGGLASQKNQDIETIHDFRERKVSTGWIEDFDGFAKNQWEDFEYKLPEGECLREVQERNIKVLHEILKSNDDRTIVIGTHGTAMSTMINYYDKGWNHEAFKGIAKKMPVIVRVDFEGMDMKELEIIDVVEGVYA